MGRVLLRRVAHLHGLNCRLVVVGRTGRAAFNARPYGTDPKASKKENKMKATVKHETSKVLKIGTNRGKPRAWVEGKFLIDADWTRGVTYNQTIENGALVLTRSHTGKKRVAGSDGRPVLDLNGGYLVPLFEGCTTFSVKIGRASCRERV